MPFQPDGVCLRPKCVVDKQRVVDSIIWLHPGSQARYAPFGESDFDVELTDHLRGRIFATLTLINTADVDRPVKVLDALQLPFDIGGDQYARLVELTS